MFVLNLKWKNNLKKREIREIKRQMETCNSWENISVFWGLAEPFDQSDRAAFKGLGSTVGRPAPSQGFLFLILPVHVMPVNIFVDALQIPSRISLSFHILWKKCQWSYPEFLLQQTAHKINFFFRLY